MKVVWSERAVEQLQQIHDYVAADSKPYARRLLMRIKRRTWQVGRFPLLGALVPEYCHDDIREVLEGAYRIFYRVSEDRAEILGVRHAARSTPPKLNE
jgi:plasmid stabilization system protein ParE